MAPRIMVGGAIAQNPLGGGGYTWAFLQYVLGFRALGYETYYVESIDAQHCIDDDWQPATFADSANARAFRDVVRDFDLEGQVALLQDGGDESIGLSRRDIERLAANTDLFVNLSGRFHGASILGAARRRMYVDLDPGFVQIWHAQYGVDMNFQGHDVFVTVGLNLGAPDCPLPTCGIRWHPTLPPVVLSEWASAAPPGPAYTTVADWRGYSPVEWRGVWYGQKSEEFLRILDLPQHVSVPLELCLAIHPDEPDRERLLAHGWRLTSPQEHTGTPLAYRDYIAGSRGELTAVKHGYVAGRTGWFSDRSACYLAAGRPVIVQDTGLGSHIPTGAGVLTFTDVASAAACLAAVEADYALHAAAATTFARQHLDSQLVLEHLVELAAL